MRKVLYLSLLSLGAVVLRAESARACSPPVCVPVVAKPASGALPVNRTGLLVDYWYEGLEYELHRVNGEATEAVETTVTDQGNRTALITPKTAWTVGEEYVLLATSCGTETEEPLAERARFTIAAEAPLPTTLGEIEVTESEPGSLNLIGGPACTWNTEADKALVALAPSEEAEAWEGALVFQLLVDGKPFVDATRSGLSGADVTVPSATVYTLCNPEEGTDTLAEGTHEVQFRATLPGTELSLLSETAQIELRCEDDTGSAGATGAGTGGTGGDDDGSPGTGGKATGGAGSGGKSTGGAATGGTATGGQADRPGGLKDEEESGCSMSPVPVSTSGVPWLVAALGAIATRAGARRRRSGDSQKPR